MKNISNALKAFLQTQRDFGRFDLIQIILPNGQSLFVTTAGSACVFQGNTYWPGGKFGVWERGAVTSEVAETPKSNYMTLTLRAENETWLPKLLYPGTSTPMFVAATLGLFDYAEVHVNEIFVAPGETPQQAINARGAMVVNAGVIAQTDRASRSEFVFKVADMLYLLNVQYPMNIIQTSCPWTLYDTRCALNINNYASPSSVAAGSSPGQIICATNPTVTFGGFTFSGLTSDYALGRIKFTSGQNNGFTYFIKDNQVQAGKAVLILSRNIVLPIQTGDTFIAYPGCNKTQVRCNQFADIANFGGMPYVPNPETAV